MAFTGFQEEEPNYNQSTEKPYQPYYHSELLKQLIQQYKKSPDSFRSDLVDKIEQDSQFYGISFNRDVKAEEFNLINTVSQLGAGFLSGFTTFHIGEEPKNPSERIANSIGHLAGFVGYVPRAPFALLGKTSRLKNAADFLRGKSVPMLAANKATEIVKGQVSRITRAGIEGQAGAVKSASEILQKTNVKDTLQQAFHLGVATSASLWQNGVDEMMHGFIGGAQTGAAFGMIGNLIKLPGATPPRLGATFFPSGDKMVPEMTGAQKADRAVRTLASSLFTGLPATIRGDTTPEQIYEYLLGAYFGMKMGPAEWRNRDKHLAKMFGDETNALKRPELTEGFDLLSKREQGLVETEAAKIWNKDGQIISQRLADFIGYNTTIPQMTKEYAEGRQTMPRAKTEVEGEIVGKMMEGKEATKEEWKSYTDKEKQFYAEAVEASNFEGYFSYSQLKAMKKKELDAIAERHQLAGRKTMSSSRLAAEIMFAQEKRFPEIVRKIKLNEDDMINDQSDVDGPVALGRPTPRTSNFVKNHVMSHKVFENLSATKKNEEWNRLTIELENLMIDAYIKDTQAQGFDKNKPRTMIHKVNPENIIQQFESIVGFRLPDSSRGYLTQTIRAKNNEIQEEFISPRVDGSMEGNAPREIYVDILKYDNYSTPVNAKGDSKILRRPVSVLEKIWNSKQQNEAEEAYRQRVEESAFYVADEVIAPGKRWYEKYNLYRFKEKLEQNLGEMGKEEFYTHFSTIMKEMQKNGRYFFGGAGDKEKAYFVKYHPELTPENMPKFYNEIRRVFGEKTFDKLWGQLEDAYIHRFGFSETADFNAAKLDKVNNLYNTTFTDPQTLRAKEGALEFYNGQKLSEHIPDLIQQNKMAFISNYLYNMQVNGYAPTVENVGKTLGKGFLNNAKAFNKRAQILMTSGYATDRDYIAKQVNDLSPSGNYNVILVNDAKGPDLGDLSKAIRYVEGTDGAIITRDGVLYAQVKEHGMAEAETIGQSKSFIMGAGKPRETIDYKTGEITETPLGAMMGKYMMFDAGPTLSKMMRDKNLHMIVYDSAMKQRGHREISDYQLKDGAITGSWDVKANAEGLRPKVYELDPADIHNVYSEKVDSHNLMPQFFMSQANTSLTPASLSRKINEESLADMHETMFTDSFVAPKHRGLTEALLKNPKDEAIQREWFNKFDEIGVPDVLKVLRTGGLEPLHDKIYTNIMNFQKTVKELAKVEGEISETDVESWWANQKEFTSSVDRMMKLSQEANESILSMGLHKWNQPYLETVMQNWVVNRLTRPKLKNSGVFRMRPYDQRMQEKIVELRDNEFYLDNSAKNMKIFSDLVGNKNGWITLGELWNNYTFGGRGDGGKYRGTEFKRHVEGIFEALNVRVPMDSVSGARVLKFKGFTDRKGYGILLHPRVMRALGGADLDGDKAYVFFGGRTADGRGEGLKRSWKEMYKANQDEYTRYYLDQPGVSFAKAKKISKEEYEGLTDAQKFGTTAPQKVDFSQYKSPRWQTMGALGRRMKVIKHLDAHAAAPNKKNTRQLVNDLMTYLEGFSNKDFGKHPIAIELKRVIKRLENNGFEFSWSKENGLFYLKNPNGKYYSNRPSQAPRQGKPAKARWIPYTSDNKHEVFTEGNFKGLTGHDLMALTEKQLEGKAPYAEALLGTNKNDKGLAYFSPFARQFMSEGAATGRQLLGSTVIMKKLVAGMHSSLDKYPKGEFHSTHDYTHRTRHKPSEDYRIHYKQTATQEKERHRTFGSLSRTGVALGSDPMDELGLQKKDRMFDLLYDSLINVNVTGVSKRNKETGEYQMLKGWPLKEAMFRIFQVKNATTLNNKYAKVDGKIKLPGDSRADTMMRRLKRGGLYEKFRDANNALYGKDHNAGQKWSLAQIAEKTYELGNIREDARNSVLPRISKWASEIDYGDSMISRVKAEMNPTTNKLEGPLIELYTDFRNEWISGKFDYLLEPLNRRTFEVKINKFLPFVLQQKLWIPKNQERLAANDKLFAEKFNELFGENLKFKINGKQVTFGEIMSAASGSNPKDFMNWKLSIIRNEVEAQNHFLMQDITDMISVRRLHKAVEESGIGLDRLSEISQEVSDFRAAAKIIGRERLKNEVVEEYTETPSAGPEAIPEIRPGNIRGPVRKIISGGQVGVDMMGLEVGREIGLQTGGTAPPGWISGNKNQRLLLESFNLVEGAPDPSKYRLRTLQNVLNSDGTILWGNMNSPGSKLTIKYLRDNGKPYLVANKQSPAEISKWLKQSNIETLNVAGNRVPPPGFKKRLTEALTYSGLKPFEGAVSKAGVKHLKDGFEKKHKSKDIEQMTQLIREQIETTPGHTTGKGHKAIWYGPVDYKYSNASHKAKKMPPTIKGLAKTVEDALGLPEGYYDSVLINKLPKGTTISAHKDNEAIFIKPNGEIGSVGVLSLGGNSTIEIQRPYGKTIERHLIKKGDIYELPEGNFQNLHYHSVGPSPKERLSLTFRRTNSAKDIEAPTQAAVEPTQRMFSREGRESTAQTQIGLDSAIKRYKNRDNLEGPGLKNDKEREIFDELMSGSLWRGNLEKLKEFEKDHYRNNTMTWSLRQWINKEKQGTAKTGMNRFAFGSQAVSDKQLKGFIQDYNKLFNKAIGNVPEKERKRVLSEVEKSEQPQVIEGIETNELRDPLEGFRKLRDGKLDKEGKEILEEAESHLLHYNKPLGKDLQGVLRYLFGKNLDSMNYEDWRNFNHTMRAYRNGDFHRSEGFGIKKLYYYLFPEAIDRDMIRKDFDLMEQLGVWYTAEGLQKVGKVQKPTQMSQKLLDNMHYSGDQQARKSDEEIGNYRKLMLHLEQHEAGMALFDLAGRQAEVKVGHDFLARKSNNPERDKAIAYTYFNNLKEAEKKYNWNELKGQVFKVETINEKGKTETRQFTAQEYIDYINQQVATQNKRMEVWANGTKEFEDAFLLLDKKGNVRRFGPGEGMEQFDLAKFERYVNKLKLEGKDVPMEVGMLNMDRAIKQVQYETAASAEHRMQIAQRPITPTKFYKSDRYRPHIIPDVKQAEVATKKALENLFNKPKSEISDKDRAIEVQKILRQHKNTTGEWEFTEFQDWHLHDTVRGHLKLIAKNMTEPQLQSYATAAQVGNLKSRKSHLEGYVMEPRIYDKYIRNMVGSFYRSLGQVMSRRQLHEWTERKRKEFGDELTDSWERFFNIYINNAAGYPAVLPKAYELDPNLNVRGTLYSWWADNKVADRTNSIMRNLGLTKKDLPKEMQGIEYRQLRDWSNLEAKWQMSALLFHPKTGVANMYGGSALTASSASFKNLRRANNINWLKSHLMPGKDKLGNEWNTLGDVHKYVQSLGVFPEMITYETGINPNAQRANVKAAISELTKKISKDPEYSDTSLREVLRKYGISERFWDSMSLFMKYTERKLRADSYVAHLIQAWENYGGTLPIDHPILIQTAKKGVKATQFLYNAPHRPMFAQTALGKVMSRFQLWSWNSVRFRNDVTREAAKRGWREGTQEFERFKRTAQIDLFMLGMSSVFMYSLFEAALPAPWNWYQDTAEWLFGDDKERDRAFFGSWPAAVAPLQMVTPPVLRMAPVTFKGLVEGDWAKMSDYTVWSMFPMGRLARDMFGPNSIIENPYYSVEKLTGLPYMQFGKQLRDEKETKNYPKGIMTW